MGKRGPKPRLAAKALPCERPYAPRGLGQAEKAAWDSLCDDLESLGTLAKVDRKLIEVFARTWALWERCVEDLGAETLATSDDKGRAFINPLCNLYLNLGARLRQMLLDFGLSPSTRAPADPGVGGHWAGLMEDGGGL